MKTRRLLSAATLGALVLSPVPALAQSDIGQIARQMRDPQMQDAMAAAIRAMSDAMLDMKIAPLLEAASRGGVDPRCCVYVGDDERDIIAGRAAGMRTIAAGWG